MGADYSDLSPRGDQKVVDAIFSTESSGDPRILSTLQKKKELLKDILSSSHA